MVSLFCGREGRSISAQRGHGESILEILIVHLLHNMSMHYLFHNMFLCENSIIVFVLDILFNYFI